MTKQMTNIYYLVSQLNSIKQKKIYFLKESISIFRLKSFVRFLGLKILTKFFQV